MAKVGKSSRSRRAERADLIDKPTSRRSQASRAVSHGWQRAWQPTRNALSKRVNLPTPKGRAGKVLGKRIRAPRYFRESWGELKRVEWPSRRESWRLTTAVFMFSVVLALFTALADYGFSKAVQKILVK